MLYPLLMLSLFVHSPVATRDTLASSPHDQGQCLEAADFESSLTRHIEQAMAELQDVPGLAVAVVSRQRHRLRSGLRAARSRGATGGYAGNRILHCLPLQGSHRDDGGPASPQGCIGPGRSDLPLRAGTLVPRRGALSGFDHGAGSIDPHLWDTEPGDYLAHLLHRPAHGGGPRPHPWGA